MQVGAGAGATAGCETVVRRFSKNMEMNFLVILRRAKRDFWHSWRITGVHEA